VLLAFAIIGYHRYLPALPARDAKTTKPWEGAVVMDDPQDRLDEAEVKAFLLGLPFVREYGISVLSIAPGQVTIEMPFAARFSGPPELFPASMVGVAGDVASCLSLLPKGWALATLDFTVKMTGAAKGEKLRAKGRVLQAGRTNSVGAAEVYVVSAQTEVLCGAILATTRNFRLAT
jgi:acyl-coenzyme A thioesterase PaaI-like protein